MLRRIARLLLLPLAEVLNTFWRKLSEYGRVVSDSLWRRVEYVNLSVELIVEALNSDDPIDVFAAAMIVAAVICLAGAVIAGIAVHIIY